MANAHPITAKDAAAEIVTLINSRAQSPRPREIEAIIARVAPAYGSSAELAQPLPEALEFLSLRETYLERLRVHGGMTPGSSGYQQAEAECDAASEALCALADRIWETTPRQTWGGVVARALLADHYSDFGTAAVGDEAWLWTTERRAIHELILSVRATDDRRLNVSGLPGQERPEQGARLAQLRKAIAAIEAAADAAGPPRQWTHAASERIDALYGPFHALTSAVWATPVLSLIDLQERAVIARHWFREKRCSDGEDRIWQHPSEVGDWGEQTIAELIHGVQRLAMLAAQSPAD